MKILFNLKQSIILSTVFIILLHSCSAQNNSADQEMDSLKLEIKIIKSIPVGWGVLYQGNIQKIVEGKSHVFNDSISFGITASKDFEYVNIDDICIITFKNTKEISKTSYLPPINGTVSNKNEIWLITKINNLSNLNKRRIFIGSAIINDGKPMFVWDLAYSQAFYLDGLKYWDKKYINKKITIEGVLSEYIDGIYSGPVITQWKIVE